MASKLIPSDPSAVMVIRDVTPNVVTLSTPFLRMGLLKIGGRATLVRLSSGTLAVFSPVALTPEVRSKVDELVSAGPAPDTPDADKVSHIIAPDMEHHIFVSDWKAAFPGAKLVGPGGIRDKRADMAGKKGNENVRTDVDGEWAVLFPEGPGKRDVRVDPVFDADFEYEFVDAHPNKELVFFFRPDRVLVQADLVFNMPAREQYSRVPEEARKLGLVERIFFSMQTTEGDDLKWPRRAQWHLFSRADRPSYNESIRRIASWDFETLIPCHGETIVGDGKERFVKLFEWHLEDGKKGQ